MTRLCAGVGLCNATSRVTHSSSKMARRTASTDQPVRAAISFSATPLSASRRMAPRWTSIGSARKCQCNCGLTRGLSTDHSCVSIARPHCLVPVPFQLELSGSLNQALPNAELKEEHALQCRSAAVGLKQICAMIHSPHAIAEATDCLNRAKSYVRGLSKSRGAFRRLRVLDGQSRTITSASPSLFKTLTATLASCHLSNTSIRACPTGRVVFCRDYRALERVEPSTRKIVIAMCALVHVDPRFRPIDN